MHICDVESGYFAYSTKRNISKTKNGKKNVKSSFKWDNKNVGVICPLRKKYCTSEILGRVTNKLINNSHKWKWKCMYIHQDAKQNSLCKLLVILFIRNSFKSCLWTLLNQTLWLPLCLAERQCRSTKHLLVSNRNKTGRHFVLVRRWIMQGYPELIMSNQSNCAKSTIHLSKHTVC